MRFRLDNSVKYKSITVSSISGQHNFYNIISKYNTVTFTENGVQHTATIKPGNYTISTLCTTVQTEINLIAPANTYLVTYDLSTKLVTFTRTEGSNLYCMSPPSNFLPSIGIKLGFEKNIAGSNLPDIGVNHYQIITYNLELRVNGPNFHTGGIQETGKFISHLSTTYTVPIPITEIYGGNILYENKLTSNTICFAQKQKITNLELSINDPLNNNEIIDNHNMNLYILFIMN